MKNNDNASARSRGILDNRLFWAILSLFAALVMWLYYTSNYGSTQTRTPCGIP